ncbi:DUF1559 domain-containing protein [bacterium]|nr:DUF1559 domain-containing protein [bacterium]
MILLRRGWSLKEVLAVIAIIGALLFLLLPSNGGHREASRRMSCSNNLKHLALALHNYHDTYNTFPPPFAGSGMGGNQNRLSGMIQLLPFVEQTKLYDDIVNTNGISSNGPAPWDKTYAPWQAKVDVFVCPSATSDVKDYRPTNYAFCIGDIAQSIYQLPAPRGVFAPGHSTTFSQIVDGTSNTIMMAEIGTPDGRSVPGQYVVDLPDNLLSDPGICYRVLDGTKRHYDKRIPLHQYGRGYNWADGGAGPAMVNTILPPNGPSCAVDGSEAVDGIYSAGSYHIGGCHVVFVDGSAHFISEKIDAGDPSSPPLIWQNQKPEPSPFGVWGALGSINDGEIIDPY